MVEYDEEAWRRVGRYLRRRRAELSPDYHQRAEWIRAVARPGFGSRVITDLELGERGNYSKETLSTAEDAYQLEPGSIRRAINEGGTPQPAAEESGETDSGHAEQGSLWADPEITMTRGFRRIASLVSADTATMSEQDAADTIGRLMEHLERKAAVWLEEEQALRMRQRPRDAGS